MLEASTEILGRRVRAGGRDGTLVAIAFDPSTSVHDFCVLVRHEDDGELKTYFASRGVWVKPAPIP